MKGAGGMNDTAVLEALRDLARESGRVLAELGVRASDEKWIREHARTIASLEQTRAPRGLARLFRRFRRRK